MTQPTLILRLANEDDAAVVRRLAQLDDSRPLNGDVLLAVLGGEAVAALSLTDGRVVANPFVRTADTVTLLELRAAQLSNGALSAPGEAPGDASGEPPRDSARARASSSRAWTPSFRYTWRRWYSTVLGLRNSVAAASRVVHPPARRRAI